MRAPAHTACRPSARAQAFLPLFILLAGCGPTIDFAPSNSTGDESDEHDDGDDTAIDSGSAGQEPGVAAEAGLYASSDGTISFELAADGHFWLFGFAVSCESGTSTSTWDAGGSVGCEKGDGGKFGVSFPALDQVEPGDEVEMVLDAGSSGGTWTFTYAPAGDVPAWDVRAEYQSSLCSSTAEASAPLAAGPSCS